MRTDSIFYRIFQTNPRILFEILGQPPAVADGYEFRSVEVKQLAFRIDGVFLPKPDAADQTVIFLETQFQKDPHFYHRYCAEIANYLKQYPQTFDWKAVVIFPYQACISNVRWLAPISGMLMAVCFLENATKR